MKQMYDDNAEKSVLGCMLADWSRADDVFAEITEDDFFDARHKVIYKTMKHFYNEGKEVDLSVLASELMRGNAEEAGGIAYVSSLTDMTVTGNNLDAYKSVVKEFGTRRRFIGVIDKFRVRAMDMKENPSSIIDECENDIQDIVDNSDSNVIDSVQDSVMSTIEKIKEVIKEKRGISGVPTGFKSLDALTTGFHKGEMIIIGARPSIGKTAIALAMAERMAGIGISVGFISLEMPKEQLIMRLLASRARISIMKIRNGLFTAAELQRLNDTACCLYNSKLFFSDKAGMTINDVKRVIKSMVRKHKVQVVFIDYIGLIRSDNNIEYWQQQSFISNNIKRFAREFNIPIVALCQVARDAEGKAPSLNQLRGSGSIEQDADVVMFLNGERGGDAILDRTIDIAKQRNGPLGRVELSYITSITKFEEKK